MSSKESTSRRRKILLGAFSLFAVTAFSITALVFSGGLDRDDPPPDVRPSGLYTTGDRVMTFTPRTSDTYRATFPATGESHAFRASADPQHWEAGPAWSDPEPVSYRVTFQESGDEIDGLLWEEDGEETLFKRLDLPEEHYHFPSGELTLRAKLVTPQGEGPFPVVVAVHGSEDTSAVDYYGLPYFLAGHGIAGLVFDKRGTGGSTGEYSQVFPDLAGDVLAAIRSLDAYEQIDPDRIFLAGFSQGGWIAPLAAARSEGAVRGVVVAYGPTVPITEEDRWGYVYQLQKKGFGDEEIAQADAINAILRDIVDHDRSERYADLSEAMDAARGQDWFEAIAGSDSLLGHLAETSTPLWAMRIYYSVRRATGKGFNHRLYDPIPTLETLDIPMLWIFGGEDSSIPSAASIEKLEELVEGSGKPIEIALFPDAEHGILHFEDIDEEGTTRRRYLGYAPDYHSLMIDWLRRESERP